MLKLNDFLYVFLIRSPAFLTVYVLVLFYNRDLSASMFFMLLAVFAITFLVSRILKNNAPFLIHCAALSVAVVVPLALLYYRYYEVFAIIAIGALYQLTKHKWYLSVLWLAVQFVCLIAALAVAIPLARVCIAAILVTALVMLLSSQMANYDKFLRTSGRHLPKKAARRVLFRNYKLLLPFFVVVALLGFAAMLPDYSGIDTTFFDWAEEVRPIREGSHYNREIDPTWLMTPGNPAGSVPEYVPPNPGWLTYLFMVITAILLILQSLPTFFLGWGRRKLSNADDEEVVFEESIIEDAEDEERDAKLTHIRTNQAVRKMFIRKVKEHKKSSGLLPQISDTPQNLSERIGEAEDVSTLNTLYHKARYSAEPVTTSELRDLRGKSSEVR